MHITPYSDIMYNELLFLLKYVLVVPEGQVYIAGLSPSVTEEDIAEFFGSLGLLRRDKRKGTPMV